MYFIGDFCRLVVHLEDDSGFFSCWVVFSATWIIAMFRKCPTVLLTTLAHRRCGSLQPLQMHRWPFCCFSTNALLGHFVREVKRPCICRTVVVQSYFTSGWQMKMFHQEGSTQHIWLPDPVVTPTAYDFILKLMIFMILRPLQKILIYWD